ncbi:MAG: glycosyltransferase family 2 protein [Chloroflexi bacterium]|nr:glycosyltransferase family 2 protein [Chloroflexota bacterium]
MTATLSVVVVSYNRRELVARCLDSLLADPDAPSLEPIVVDNASADGTAAAVGERYPTVRVIANGENVGYGRACNQGLAVARGRYLMVLNQDIVVRPGSLAALVRFADAHPDAALVGARLEYEDGRFQHSAFRLPDWKQALFGFFDGLAPLDSERNGRYPPSSYDHPFQTEHLLGACLLLRREAVEQFGLFDPAFFMYYEETDLCARALKAGWRNYYCPDARVMHVSAASTSAASEKMSVEFHRSQAIFYHRHYGGGGYALLKAIVWAGTAYRFARSLRAVLRRRISPDLFRERCGGYWRILWF